MRKLSLYMITTLDGLIAGDNGEFDDYEPSAEEMAFANQLFGAAGGIVFGRVIYELFSYWDTLDLADPAVSQADREFASNFRTLPRVVFSRTLKHVDEGTLLISDDIAAAVTRLKQQPGGDLLLLCGPELLATLVALGLVDEYRLLIRPIALGHGKALFGALPTRLQLQLVATKVFESGVVMQHYQPA